MVCGNPNCRYGTLVLDCFPPVGTLDVRATGTTLSWACGMAVVLEKSESCTLSMLGGGLFAAVSPCVYFLVRFSTTLSILAFFSASSAHDQRCSSNDANVSESLFFKKDKELYNKPNITQNKKKNKQK